MGVLSLQEVAVDEAEQAGRLPVHWPVGAARWGRWALWPVTPSGPGTPVAVGADEN